MKILAFGDLHSDKRALNILIDKAKLKSPELLVCSGDISDFGENIEEIFGELNKLKIPMLIIPGNHEDSRVIDQLCKRYKFAINIHKGCYEKENYCFFGYGEGGFSEEDPDFERITERFIETIDKEKKIILVVHSPVYNTKTDFLNSLGHRGSKSIRKFIEKYNPKLVVCGHFHETFGEIDNIKNTTIINPGPVGKIILI